MENDKENQRIEFEDLLENLRQSVNERKDQISKLTKQIEIVCKWF